MNGLDVDTQEMLRRLPAGPPGPREAVRLRAWEEAAAAMFWPRKRALVSVVDATVAGVPVRRYRAAAEGALPVIVFVHGGGWVTGSLETYDGLCRELSASTGAEVVSVDYRLAPEHRWPAQLDDVVAVMQWARCDAPADRVDRRRVALAGDSAGGHLAALAAQRALTLPGAPLRHQLLVYPVTDLRMRGPAFLGDRTGEAEGLQWYRDQLAAAPDDPATSPLLAPSLAGLPGATVVLAEVDLLTAEGIAYSRRLRTAGVRVTVHTAPGVCHGFFTWQDHPAAGAARASAWAELTRSLHELGG